MSKRILSLLIAGITIILNSTYAQQSYVHQVIVLNEGQYDYVSQTQITPVSIGSYDLLTKTYNVFDILEDISFASDVIIDGDYIYVAADSLLLKYDKNSLTLDDVVTIEGIRKMAVWNNQILITRGESMALNSYFLAYDKNTLNLIYELDIANGPTYTTEGVVVLNDTAYVAVSNGFVWGSEKGYIGLVDLNSQSYMEQIDIMPDGKNPDNLMISGNKLYTLNNTDWTSSSITEFNCMDRTFITTNLSAPSGCGASVFADNNIYYHRYDYNNSLVDTNSTLNLFNITTQQIDTVYPSLLNVYGMADDYINEQMFVTTTDFSSFGMAYVMQYDGSLIDSFAVGVSSGNLAIDVRTVSNVNGLDKPEFSVAPVPANDKILISYPGLEGGTMKVYDLMGGLIKELSLNRAGIEFELDIHEFSNGMYLLSIEKDGSTVSKRFIKS